MSTPVSKLEGIRDGITLALQQFPDFAGLTSFDNTGAVVIEHGIPQSSIIAKQKGDLASALVEAINRYGLSIVVTLLGARNDGSQSVQAFMDKIRVMISVSEQVTANQDTSNGGSGLGAMFVAERILAALKDLDLGIDGVSPIVPDDSRDTIEDVTGTKEIEAGFYCLNVHFRTKALLTARATP